MPTAPSIEEIKERIDLFLLGLSNPVLLEPGKVVIDLSSSSYTFSTEYNKLLLQVWNDETNFVRHIVSIKKEAPNRMEIVYQKFGKEMTGTLILSQSKAEAGRLDRRSQRVRYVQNLRQYLGQIFPEWKVKQLTTEPALAQSFSARFARGVLSRGQRAWAVIGISDKEENGREDILTFGLLWLDWLRKNSEKQVIEGLRIFVPEGSSKTTLQRLAWMNADRFRWEVYETGDEVRKCEPAEEGNLTTALAPLPAAQHRSLAGQRWGIKIEALNPVIQSFPGRDGYSTWSLQGLPFARETARGVVYGIGRSETMLGEGTWEDLQKLVLHIAQHRTPNPLDPNHPYFRLQPERWLQDLLMMQVDKLGESLLAEPVYRQVTNAGGLERGVLDLLAIDTSGRLAVVELKASEDIHLPLQALDYWMRVRLHQQRGDLAKQGYFRGREISPQPPRLFLVSPGLQFHPACDIVLRYFSPAIETVRIGLNENWREHLKVMYWKREGSRTGKLEQMESSD